MSFSYIDFPLESESAFWVLNDLRLVLSFDKLSLSSYNLQLEKERYETWVIFFEEIIFASVNDDLWHAHSWCWGWFILTDQNSLSILLCLTKLQIHIFLTLDPDDPFPRGLTVENV